MNFLPFFLPNFSKKVREKARVTKTGGSGPLGACSFRNFVKFGYQKWHFQCSENRPRI